eukprot:gnl/MRDRNA2_/MRDRNA2_91805_c0_seq1.p1 gnl/MRDRNA2_/MRDRNA2_91805_c0~~gnl/MRDRNA2_/MRDRNA2_91805_c0_seq1.p1  ORF type:complete len:256 (-),score=65.87 gnl/MRDRNA2_/MRDRNA2_91805_c0_seq1:178-945(-)
MVFTPRGSTCLAVQCFIALALAEQAACNGMSSANVPDGGMSCLLQKQTSVAKAGLVAESGASAQVAEEDEEMDHSGSDAEGVKKHHHHHHERNKEEGEAHAPTTTDEWADYLVDGTTSTAPGSAKEMPETPVSEESEPSWFWKFLCWIDFLHWFTPVPADEATTTVPPLNTTGNVSNDTSTNVTANDTSAEAPAIAGNETAKEDSNKTELNNTNTTKDPHAPLPASLEELQKDKKAPRSKASKRHKKKHSSHKSD